MGARSIHDPMRLLPPLLVLVLLLVTPYSAAQDALRNRLDANGQGPATPSLTHPMGKDILINTPQLKTAVSVPCLDVNVTITRPDTGEPERVSSIEIPTCGPQHVSFTWNGSTLEGEGTIKLNILAMMDSQVTIVSASCDPHTTNCMQLASVGGPTLIDTSLFGVLVQWMGWHRPPPPTSLLPGSTAEFQVPVSERDVSITIRFHVVWDVSDCAASQGQFEADIDGTPAPVQAPPDFLASLCKLTRSDDTSASAITRDGARATATALSTLARATPTLSADLQPMALALHELARGAPLAPIVSNAAVAPASDADPAAGGEAAALLSPNERSAQAHAAAEGQAGARVNASAATSVPPMPHAVHEPSTTSLRRAATANEIASTNAPRPLSTPRAIELRPAPSSNAAPFPADAHDPGATSSRRVGIATVAPPHPPVPARALAMAAVGLGGAALLLVAFALYQRVARPRALDEPHRQALHQACMAQGRGTVSELARLVGIERKLAEYHLLYLAGLDLLRVEQDDRGRRVFAAPLAPKGLALAPLAERALSFVQEQPGAVLSDIASALGITRNRADRCMKDLWLEGNVTARWEDGRRRYYAPLSLRPQDAP
jgi:hypothetical protein